MRDLATNFLPPNKTRSNISETRLFSLRMLWHRVYDPCPLLEKTMGDRHGEFFDHSLEVLNDRQHALDWSLHLELIEILQDFQPKVSIELLYELAAASAVNWCFQDWSNYLGVAIVHRALPGECIVAEKVTQPFSAPDCFVIPSHFGSLQEYTHQPLSKKDFENEKFDFGV